MSRLVGYVVRAGTEKGKGGYYKRTKAFSWDGSYKEYDMYRMLFEKYEFQFAKERANEVGGRVVRIVRKNKTVRKLRDQICKLSHELDVANLAVEGYKRLVDSYKEEAMKLHQKLSLAQKRVHDCPGGSGDCKSSECDR